MLMYQAMEGRIINISICTFLLVRSVLLGSCDRPNQIPEDLALGKEPPEMIQIQNLTLTDDTLTLNYRVSNPFDDDIRVCHDTWVHGDQKVQHATTRIYGETVWIILGLNVERSLNRSLLPTSRFRSVVVDEKGGFERYAGYPKGGSH